MSQKSISRLALLLASVALISTQSAFAGPSESEELQELLNLSLEDLTVSVASKRNEKLSEAPGVVSVVTAKDIEKYGALNLRDLFNRLPSMQVYSSTFYASNIMSLRGQSDTHYTNRILFLINGRPFRDSWGGAVNSPLFLTFPVSSIERMEIIRGPGSVLYGSNAFSGVVNIISKKGQKNQGAEISALTGSFGRTDTEGSWGTRGDDWDISTAFKTSYANGWNFTATDEADSRNSFDRKEKGHSYMLSGHYKDLSMTAFSSRVEERMYTGNGLFQGGTGEINRQFIDLGYEHDVSSNIRAKLNATHNNFEFDDSSTNVGNVSNTAYDTNIEATIEADIRENMALLVGSSIDFHDGEVIGLDYQTRWYNAYAQFDYKPTDWLKLVGGIQMNSPKGTKKDYSPRAAIIAKLNDQWTAKLLYGQAFRAAYALETSVQLSNLIGVPGLKPESIETFEAQIGYQGTDMSASATLYRSRIQDIIGRIPAGAALTYTNRGEEVHQGLELEVKKDFGYGWSMDGSAFIYQSENDQNIENPTFTPNVMLKAGVHYQSSRGWGIGVYNSYFAAPEDVHSIASSSLKVNTAPDSYNMLTANARFDVPKLLGKSGQIPEMTFILFGENLLDEDINYPDFNRRNINSIPIEGGAAVYGKLSVKF